MSTPPPKSPVLGLSTHQLTAEQVSQLKELGKEITFWQGEINRAKKIGLDMTTLQQQLDQAEQLRQAILNEYK